MGEGCLLGHLEAELHALVVAAEDVGDATDGGIGLAEEGTYCIDGAEQLVCIIEDAEVGAVHTYGAGLVQESEGTIHLQGLGGAVKGVGARGNSLVARGDAECLVLVEGVGRDALRDADLGKVGAQFLLDAGGSNFAAGFGEEVLTLETDFGLLVGP